jgi:hypothetical protein
MANVVQFFLVDLWESTPVARQESGYYRPLLLLDLAIDRAFVGLSPGWHHLHGLAWHLGACALLAWWMAWWGISLPAVTAGVALFALHPAQVEAVVFVSARNDAMAAAGLFAALAMLEGWEWLRNQGMTASPRVLLWAGACVLAAALCKESVLVAPLLLVVVSWGRSDPDVTPRRLIYGSSSAHGAVLCGLVAYAGLRAVAGVRLPEHVDLAHLAAALGPSLAVYAHKLLVPFGLSPGLHLAWLEQVPWFALAAAMVLAGCMTWLGGRRAVAGLGFALVAFVPALAGIAHHGGLPDRYLYLPMAGISVMVAALVEQVGSPSERPKLTARGRARLDRRQWCIAWILVAGGLVLTQLQRPLWTDDRTLWVQTLERAPSPYTFGIYAKMLEEEGDLEEAVEWNRLAVQGPRPYQEACFRVTALQLRRGDMSAVVQDGEAALAAGCARSPELLAPLSLGLAVTGKWERAAEIAGEVGQDPTGKAVVVWAASQAREGNLEPLHRARVEGFQESVASGLMPLEEQVAWLLDQSGDSESAEQVRRAYEVE